MTDPKGPSGPQKKVPKTRMATRTTIVKSTESVVKKGDDKKSIASKSSEPNPTPVHHPHGNGNGNGNGGGKPELPKLAEAQNQSPEQRAEAAERFRIRQDKAREMQSDTLKNAQNPETIELARIHEDVTAKVAASTRSTTERHETIESVGNPIEKGDTMRETMSSRHTSSFATLWPDHRVPILWALGVILFLIILGFLIYFGPTLTATMTSSEKPNAAVSTGKLMQKEKTVETKTEEVKTTTVETDSVMPPGGLVGAGPATVIVADAPSRLPATKTPLPTPKVGVVKSTSTTASITQSEPMAPTTVTTTVTSKASTSTVELKKKPQAAKPKEAKVATTSTAYLPMARKGEIDNPKMLAARIRESLRKDASGNGQVRGANISPKGFLLAITMAGGGVDGVEALPVYLDSLVEGDMPQGSIAMSRVIETRSSSGVKNTELDIKRGYSREGRSGERGWYDANTGNLIMAGDCSNSPLAQVKGPVTPTSKPAPVEAAKPPPVSTPPPVIAQAPPVVPAFQGCTEGKYLRINIWDKSALDVPGVRPMIEETRRETNSQFKPSRISRSYWKTFLDMEKAGTLKRAASTHTAEVWVDHNGGKIPVWSGHVQSGVQRIPMPLAFVEGSVLRVTFRSSVTAPLESPLDGGLYVAYPEYKSVGCGFNFNVVAIER